MRNTLIIYSYFIYFFDLRIYGVGMELVRTWYGVGMEESVWKNSAQINTCLHSIIFDNLIGL